MTFRDLVPWLIDTSKGNHYDNPKIQHCEVQAFVLNPGHRNDTYSTKLSKTSDNLLPLSTDNPLGAKKLGNLAISGERVPLEPIYVEIHTNMMTVFVPYWLDEEELATPRALNKTFS